MANTLTNHKKIILVKWLIWRALLWTQNLPLFLQLMKIFQYKSMKIFGESVFKQKWTIQILML